MMRRLTVAVVVVWVCCIVFFGCTSTSTSDESVGNIFTYTRKKVEIDVISQEPTKDGVTLFQVSLIVPESDGDDSFQIAILPYRFQSDEIPTSTGIQKIGKGEYVSITSSSLQEMKLGGYPSYYDAQGDLHKLESASITSWMIVILYHDPETDQDETYLTVEFRHPVSY